MIITKDINPKKKTYYIGALIINELKHYEKTFDFLEVYHKLKTKEDISINLFSLSLDWLFILGAVKINKKRLEKCF